jgi:hypothetical protein
MPGMDAIHVPDFAEMKQKLFDIGFIIANKKQF